MVRRIILLMALASLLGAAATQAANAGEGKRGRNLARAVAQAYLDSRARLGFPMAPKEWASEVLALIEKKAA